MKLAAKGRPQVRYEFSTPYHFLQCYKVDSGGHCVAPRPGNPNPCKCDCVDTPGRCPCPERLALILKSPAVMSGTKQPNGRFVEVREGMYATSIEYLGAFPHVCFSG